MPRYLLQFFMIWATALVSPAIASVRTSGTYSIPAEGLDAGGSLSTSTTYSHSCSIGGVTGTASSASYGLATGVPQQTANNPPQVADYGAATAYETPLHIDFADLLAGASDPDGDIPFLASAAEVSLHGGSVELQASSIHYVPADGFSGTDSFQFRVSDGRGGLISAMVNVEVGDNPATGGQGALVPTITLEGSAPKIRFQTNPETGWMLQRSTDGMATWQDVGIITSGPTGIIEWDETAQPLPPSAFYRFRQP